MVLKKSAPTQLEVKCPSRAFSQRITASIDNDKILSEVLADRVKVARDERYPSASSLLDSIGNTGVIFK